MPVSVLIGIQWGDEGKGKIIDVLTENIDMVVRFQGGNNAGHTVEIGNEKYVLHLVPSGIFRKDIICVIGNGLVVDPVSLMEEMKELAGKGIDISNIQLSSKAHLVMAYHKIADASREAGAGAGKLIGTTKRGIGPTYSAKADRTGIRACEMLKPQKFEKTFREQATSWNAHFKASGVECVDIESQWKKLSEAIAYLTPHIKDTVLTVNEAVRQGKNILFEGAQGALLDIDHGTYPFVTSSSTTAGGACTGSGIPPKAVGCTYGVMKAYTTRVGEGPFPTELHGEEGETMRKIGREFGATTGRPRRCGWFDAILCRYSCMVNGVDKLTITKLDVLDTYPELKICTAYELNGAIIKNMPLDPGDLSIVKPVYETMPGWMTSTAEARSFNELPENARKYLSRIASLSEAEIGIVSVGPRRDQTFKI